jgi:hypothetical protein
MHGGSTGVTGPKAEPEIAAPKQKDHIVHRAADDCSFQSANGSEASGGCRPIGNEADELVAKKVLERSLSGMTEIALRQQGICPPFPFPPRASRGGWVPPTPGGTLRAKKERLARIDAAGSPPKRAAAPLEIPCECAGAGVGPVRNNRMFTEAPEIGRRWRIGYTKTRNCACCKKRKAATAS